QEMLPAFSRLKRAVCFRVPGKCKARITKTLIGGCPSISPALFKGDVCTWYAGFLKQLEIVFDLHKGIFAKRACLLDFKGYCNLLRLVQQSKEWGRGVAENQEIDLHRNPANKHVAWRDRDSLCRKRLP